MRSPVVWLGGKGRLSKKLLPLIPAHHTYVEAFGGGASLLFAKPPSPVEVYNDLDAGLVNFFRVLRDPVQFAAFQRLITLTPYARTEFDHCLATWHEQADPVTRAYRWYVVARMSFGGMFGSSWGSAVTWSRRGMAGTASKYLSIIEHLPAIAERLLRVQVENADWRVILERYDTPETFFYLDPPYVPATRRGGGYAHELTAAEHAELARVLGNVRGLVMLSGYAHELYAPLAEAGWQRRDFNTTCYAAARTRATGLQGAGACEATQSRVESVWLNYEVQRSLF